LDQHCADTAKYYTILNESKDFAHDSKPNYSIYNILWGIL